jgi:hypothetical protein
MSRYNIKFIEIDESEHYWCFDINTCDFSDRGDNQLIGVLSISKDDESMDFLPSGLWSDKHIIPIQSFDLKEEELRQLIQKEAYDLFYVGWLKRIHSKARLILADRIKVSD